MGYNMVEILNTIRENASAEYQSRIPEATKTNIENVGSAITSYSADMNEFLNALVNRIALTVVQNKTFKNPLALLKKGSVPLGQGIEEIYTNPSLSKTYTYDSQDLLKVTPPDTKACFYKLNRQDKYSVTISIPELIKAFTNDVEFTSFLNRIINTLYSGDNYDEFILMKNLVSTMYKNNHVIKVNLFDENTETLTEKEKSEKFAKALKIYSKLFTFPSSKYNKYKDVKSSETGVTTWTPLEDQIVLMNAVISANTEFDVLGYAYNKDKVSIEAQSLDVDDFGKDNNILGLLCDKSLFQVRDHLTKMDSFYNIDNLSTKYLYHHWQSYGYSLLCNAIVFTYTPKTE